MPQLIADLTGVPVRLLSERDVAAIEASPQAQLRTARYKKAVYVLGSLVFKGPYLNKDAALIHNLRFTYAIGLLETTLKLPEWERSALPWQFLGVAPGERYYLAAPNVGRRTRIPFLVVSSRLEAEARVVPRGTAVERVSDLEVTGHLTPAIKTAVLQHLYFRYLLGIGDSGTHNVLVRQDYPASGRLIAGIDLEEARSVKEKMRRLDHLFKKLPSKKQVQLYESNVCKIKSLSKYQLDQRILNELIAVGIDVTKLLENIGLWESMD